MDEGPTISYPVAVVAGRPDENYARAFVEFLASSSARPAFEEAGFVFLPAAKADAK
jgi:ABC-type molybdate transport system substrate-binding protein